MCDCATTRFVRFHFLLSNALSAYVKFSPFFMFPRKKKPSLSSLYVSTQFKSKDFFNDSIPKLTPLKGNLWLTIYWDLRFYQGQFCFQNSDS
jgi:hypothetical protein